AIWQSDGTIKLPDAENSASGNGFYSNETFGPGVGILMYMKTEFVTSEIRLGLSNSDFTNSFVFRSEDLDQYLQSYYEVSTKKAVWANDINADPSKYQWITHPTGLDSIEDNLVNYPSSATFASENGKNNIFAFSWLKLTDIAPLPADTKNTIRWYYNTTQFPTPVESTPAYELDSGSLPLYFMNKNSTSPVYIDKVIVRLLQEDEPVVEIDTTTNELIGHYELASVSVDRGNNDGGIKLITKDSAYDRINPRLSPDGYKIVYMADVGDGQYDVYLINSGGGESTRLTSYEDNDKDPTFSPDGKKIIYLQETDAVAIGADAPLTGTISVIMTMNEDGTG
ncbi:MAG TPA: hypothetical protein PKL57_21920, partial [Candidatus Wallbacteria bacterium]|nr:hypothetical protein [Candidatus Wallbacteria bacterium]